MKAELSISGSCTQKRAAPETGFRKHVLRRQTNLPETDKTKRDLPAAKKASGGHEQTARCCSTVPPFLLRLSVSACQNKEDPG